MVIFESAVGCRSTRSSVPFIPESEYLIPSTGKDSLPSAAEGSRLVIYLVEGGSKANSHRDSEGFLFRCCWQMRAGFFVSSH